MREALYRSENLTVLSTEDGRRLEFEIRFTSSSTRGTAVGVCPRCGKAVRPTHWEIEGPDGTGNTVWMACERADCDGEGEFRWSRAVMFGPWVER